MSLTSHLKNPLSPIWDFIKQRFAHTTTLTKPANQQLKSSTTLRPVLTPGMAYPYGPVGAAIDYRIRYAFALTPYRQLVAWQGARLLTYPPQLVRAFFERLHATLQTIQPVGKRLALEEERILARYCYVLSLFEEVFRSTSALHGPLLNPAPRQSIDELLALPPEICIDDLCNLFALFYDRYQHLLSLPHTLNPTFAGSTDIGGADADFIVDGCLVDIKTSITPQLSADHLRQLAGYLLLDYHDAFPITSLGIYMARQGMLFTWSVEEFLQQLTGEANVSLPALRQTFQQLCRSYGTL